MLERLDEIISRECELSKHDPIIIGVSGGMDSLSLLDILYRLGYSVIAAHFNHGIRPDAHRDADLVFEFTESRNIPCIFDAGSATEFSTVQSLSIEEAARILRYRFLFRQAKVINAQAVVVAHSANDQVETLLMHLLRGAGLDGLKGMSTRLLPNEWSSTIPLVRPLLKIWRKAIAAYCDDNKIESIQDSTNEDTKYFRNRLRHELLPDLNTYIPGVGKRLLQTSELLRGDHEFLELAAREVWHDLSIFEGEGFIAFSRSQFNQLHLSIKRRLIRKSISVLNPDARDINYALVKRVLDFLVQPSNTFQADIGLGLMVFLENEKIYISSGKDSLPHDLYPRLEDELGLIIPGKNQLSNGWVLIGEILDDAEEVKNKVFKNLDLFQSWMDLKNNFTNLRMKCRQPGDRFAPLGMDGKRVKISDLMINMKIPRRVRDHWPLVCFGEEIVWVPGYRLANSVKIDQSTSVVIHLQLRFNDIDGNSAE